MVQHPRSNSRTQLDLIDVQSQAYNDFCFITMNQDHLTKYMFFKNIEN